MNETFRSEGMSIDANDAIINSYGKTWGTKETCLKCQWLREPKNYGVCEWHGTEQIKPKHHIGNGKPKGIFAGTLTMSSSWPTNEEEMVSSIKKIFRQKTTPVKRYVWFVERTDAGLPHIHFIYETFTGGRITQQVFKRNWQWWDESTPCGRGHVGGYHRYCHAEEEYIDYISKDKGRHENKWTN